VNGGNRIIRERRLLREPGPDGDRIHLSADGTPLALVNDGTVYYLHPGRLGTVQRITDANQQFVARVGPISEA